MNFHPTKCLLYIILVKFTFIPIQYALNLVIIRLKSDTNETVRCVYCENVFKEADIYCYNKDTLMILFLRDIFFYTA